MNDATASGTLSSAEHVNAMAEHFATGTWRARVADVTVTNLGGHVITFDTAHINERAGRHTSLGRDVRPHRRYPVTRV